MSDNVNQSDIDRALHTLRSAGYKVIVEPDAILEMQPVVELDGDGWPQLVYSAANARMAIGGVVEIEAEVYPGTYALVEL